jgi:hypothetical protein
MTATLDGATTRKQEDRAVRGTAGRRRAGSGCQGTGLVVYGPEGLLKQLTKTVSEAALNEEMAEHLRLCQG